jgi:hypothetical protein
MWLKTKRKNSAKAVIDHSISKAFSVAGSDSKATKRPQKTAGQTRI